MGGLLYGLTVSLPLALALARALLQLLPAVCVACDGTTPPPRSAFPRLCRHPKRRVLAEWCNSSGSPYRQSDTGSSGSQGRGGEGRHTLLLYHINLYFKYTHDDIKKKKLHQLWGRTCSEEEYVAQQQGTDFVDSVHIAPLPAFTVISPVRLQSLHGGSAHTFRKNRCQNGCVCFFFFLITNKPRYNFSDTWHLACVEHHARLTQVVVCCVEAHKQKKTKKTSLNVREQIHGFLVFMHTCLLKERPVCTATPRTFVSISLTAKSGGKEMQMENGMLSHMLAQ